MPELRDDELAALVRSRLEVRQPRHLQEHFAPRTRRSRRGRWAVTVAAAAILLGVAATAAVRPDLGSAVVSGVLGRLPDATHSPLPSDSSRPPAGRPSSGGRPAPSSGPTAGQGGPAGAGGTPVPAAPPQPTSGAGPLAVPTPSLPPLPVPTPSLPPLPLPSPLPPLPSPLPPLPGSADRFPAD